MITYADGAAYIDGDILPINDARIPITDWGFLKSDIAYDVVGVTHGTFFRLDDHLKRFAESMRYMHLTCPVDDAEISRILNICVARSGLRDAYVMMITSRGRNKKGTRDPRDCENAFYAFAVPYIWILPKHRHTTGLSLKISSIMRIPEATFDPRAKNFQWGDMIQALYQSYEDGNETSVLLDADGNITEGPGFNIFVYNGTQWTTPRKGVLEGITRKSAMHAIAQQGMKIAPRDVTPAQMQNADEIFATSTAGGIMPITSVNGNKIGNGAMGPATKRVYDAYWSMHSDPAFSHPVDYAITDL